MRKIPIIIRPSTDNLLRSIAYSCKYFKAFDLTKAGLAAIPVLLGLLVLVASVWRRILRLV